MRNSLNTKRLNSAQRFADKQLRLQFFHPGSNLPAAQFRVEVVCAHNDLYLALVHVDAQMIGDAAVPAASHAVDLENGFHGCKINI